MSTVTSEDPLVGSPCGSSKRSGIPSNYWVGGGGTPKRKDAIPTDDETNRVKYHKDFTPYKRKPTQRVPDDTKIVQPRGLDTGTWIYMGTSGREGNASNDTGTGWDHNHRRYETDPWVTGPGWRFRRKEGKGQDR